MEIMINSVKGKIIKDIVNKGAYRKFHDRINKRAVLLLQALSDVSNFDDLRRICEPPTLKLHKLKGNMKDFWSITIEKPWCIIFKYQQGEFVNVEIKDCHD
ncbi:MAG: type II toxin-antitoxin system RelE/ParE family toxin [Nitrospira sp.]|nr:type II toxin-antitoxin system RelE/ParE family toxin [Nitrospira sp.]